MSRLASFLGIDARQFGFDLGKVSSTNFKVGGFLRGSPLESAAREDGAGHEA